MKPFLKILCIQIFTIPVIIILFKILNSNKTAGLVAGISFLLLSSYFIYELVKKTKFLKTFSFYGVLTHLVLAVIPMLVIRLINWNVSFDSLVIAGIKATDFHQISEKIYTIMILCTFLDLLRIKVLKFSLSHEVD